jgi:hypothetical protein
MTSEGSTYIEESPEELGVRCLRIELSLSPAILDILWTNWGSGERIAVEEWWLL